MPGIAEQAADRAPADAGARPCRNCGAPATSHYCAHCGQETRLALPTFGTFMREAAGRYVALDGRMWRTLAALIARPGFLTLEYLQGRRRRYIRPARLFLVLYLMLFALIGLVQSPTDIANEVIIVKSDDDTPAAEAGKEAGAAAGSGAGQAIVAAVPKPSTDGRPKISIKAATEDRRPRGIVDTEDDTLIGLDKDLDFTLRVGGRQFELPPELRKRYDHFKNLPRQEKAEQLYAGVLRYGTYAMVALLPAFALLLKIAYLGRGRHYPGRPTRYAEHLVYSAHLHAFMALMIMLLIALPFSLVKIAIALWMVYYVMSARQTVYRGRWWAGVLRAFLILVAYSVLIAFAMLGLLAAAVMLR